MKIIKSKTLTEKQKLEIIVLWNNEYPKALILKDIVAFNNYLKNLTDKRYMLLIDDSETIMGWFIDFIRDNERCFAMLLNSSLQGKGWGSKLLDKAKKQCTALNGWVIPHHNEPKQNGENYKSPIEFYRKNNFQILLSIQLKNKNIDGIKVKWQKEKTANG